MTRTETLWEHDGSDSIYLGPYREGDVKYDLYWAPQHGMPTAIARFGDDGPEYTSGMEIAKSGISPPLSEAMERAKIIGLPIEIEPDIPYPWQDFPMAKWVVTGYRRTAWFSDQKIGSWKGNLDFTGNAWMHPTWTNPTDITGVDSIRQRPEGV